MINVLRSVEQVRELEYEIFPRIMCYGMPYIFEANYPPEISMQTKFSLSGHCQITDEVKQVFNGYEAYVFDSIIGFDHADHNRF